MCLGVNCTDICNLQINISRNKQTDIQVCDKGNKEVSTIVEYRWWVSWYSLYVFFCMFEIFVIKWQKNVSGVIIVAKKGPWTYYRGNNNQ